MSETPAIIASGFPGKREDAHRAGITIAAFMDLANGISGEDRALMRRLSIALAAIFVFTFAYSQLHLMYSHKFFNVTGRAQWIWMRHRLAAGTPIAFFATRDFDLTPDRYFTRIKIAADPEYTLYFNGQMIAGRHGEEGSILDVYDVTKLAHDGRNRIVIAARSANGVGGVIAAVDTRPDFHLLASDATWHIVGRWTDDLPLRDPAGALAKPLLLGRPPAGQWNELTAREGHFMKPPQRVITPVQAIAVNAALMEINVVGGVAVAGSKPTPGIAYDFGGNIDGRVQLITSESGLVRIRRGYWLSDLTPAEGPVEAFVLAAGERAITDPEVRNFRYVLVYGGQAKARVVQ